MLRLLGTLKTSRDLLSDRQIGSAGVSLRGDDIRTNQEKKEGAGAQITQARFKHCRKYMDAHRNTGRVGIKDTMGGKEVRSATVEHKVREQSGRDGQNGYDTRKLERSATTGTRDIVERA